MNRLSVKERASVINCLVEGCSIRSAVRMTGICKRTVLRLLVEIGDACAVEHDRLVRNLNCKLLQVGEIWSFTHCKEKNILAHLRGADGIGDTWTWVAIDAKSKLIPCWHVGKRSANDAYWFIRDLKGRLAHRVQLTSDGLRAYLEGVEDAFGTGIDFARLVKLYGQQAPVGEARYSPPACIGTQRKRIVGNPDPALVSPSYVERQNLTVRISNRRFTRLMSAFSKKLENHKHSVALNFFHCNFCRIHQTLTVTPAMEAGIADHVWSLEEVARLLDKRAK